MSPVGDSSIGSAVALLRSSVERESEARVHAEAAVASIGVVREYYAAAAAGASGTAIADADSGAALAQVQVRRSLTLLAGAVASVQDYVAAVAPGMAFQHGELPDTTPAGGDLLNVSRRPRSLREATNAMTRHAEDLSGFTQGAADAAARFESLPRPVPPAQARPATQVPVVDSPPPGSGQPAGTADPVAAVTVLGILGLKAVQFTAQRVVDAFFRRRSR